MKKKNLKIFSKFSNDELFDVKDIQTYFCLQTFMDLNTYILL